MPGLFCSNPTYEVNRLNDSHPKASRIRNGDRPRNRSLSCPGRAGTSHAFCYTVEADVRSRHHQARGPKCRSQEPGVANEPNSAFNSEYDALLAYLYRL